MDLGVEKLQSKDVYASGGIIELCVLCGIVQRVRRNVGGLSAALGFTFELIYDRVSMRGGILVAKSLSNSTWATCTRVL